MKSKMQPLTTMLSFRVTDVEAKRVEQLAERQERKPADMARLIFRKGLQAESRVK